MRAILIGAFCLLLSNTMAQINVSTEAYPEPKVYQVPGKSKAVLFQEVSRWVLANIHYTASPIVYQNAAEGRIIAKGSTAVSYPFGAQTYDFTLNIDVKEGKVRVGWEAMDYTDPRIRSQATGLLNPAYSKGNKPYADKTMQKLVDQLVEALTKGKADNQNW